MKMVVHPSIDPQGKSDEELLELTRQAISSALPKGEVLDQTAEPYFATSPGAA
jgi:hypothetical protein